ALPRERARKPLDVVFDAIRTGFAAERRLRRLQLTLSMAPEGASMPIEEDSGMVAIAGGVFATMAWLQGVDEPQVEVHADASVPGTLKIEIVQRMVRVPVDVAHLEESMSADDPMAGIAWRAL